MNDIKLDKPWLCNGSSSKPVILVQNNNFLYLFFFLNVLQTDVKEKTKKDESLSTSKITDFFPNDGKSQSSPGPCTAGIACAVYNLM